MKKDPGRRIIHPEVSYGKYDPYPEGGRFRAFSQNTVILRTTAGTKSLLRQPLDNEVVVGSFVNSQALLDKIFRKTHKLELERITFNAFQLFAF